MEPLFIVKTETSPEIVFDHGAGFFSIKGESRPEYPRKFYQKAFDWFDAYFMQAAGAKVQQPIHLTVDFDYFNSTSAKVIYELLIRMRSGIRETGGTLLVTWYHDKLDEDMMHSGKELETLTELPFRFEAK